MQTWMIAGKNLWRRPVVLASNGLRNRCCDCRGGCSRWCFAVAGKLLSRLVHETSDADLVVQPRGVRASAIQGDKSFLR